MTRRAFQILCVININLLILNLSFCYHNEFLSGYLTVTHLLFWFIFSPFRQWDSNKLMVYYLIKATRALSSNGFYVQKTKTINHLTGVLTVQSHSLNWNTAAWCKFMIPGFWSRYWNCCAVKEDTDIDTGTGVGTDRALHQTLMSSPPAGRMLRLPSVCPGLRVAWVQISSPRMAPCHPSPPARTTKSPPTTTTTTTTTCSSTPSAHPQTLPPSSQPPAAWLATDRPAIREPLPPPTTATTTIPPCLADSPSPLRPAPTGAPYPDRSATPSCPRPRCCRRPTASLRCSSRPLPPRRHCPTPV